jgi:hypothetical protein
MSLFAACFRHRTALALTVACLGVGAGCSVINAYDDVEPLDQGSGGSAGTAGTGATGGGGTAGDGGTSGSSGSAGTGGTGGADAGPPVNPGLVVASGVPGGRPSIVTIDPKAGTVLRTSAGGALAIAYDPVAPDDPAATPEERTFNRFYFFEEYGPVPRKVQVVARVWDPTLKDWVKKGELLDVAKPAVGTQIVVLRNRIAYLGEVAGVQKLIVINTTRDTPAVLAVTLPAVDTAAAVALDITGTPRTDAARNGGTINFLTKDCAADAGAGVCESVLQAFGLENALTSTNPTPMGLAKGRVVVRSPQRDATYIALLQPPDGFGSTVTRILPVDPTNHSARNGGPKDTPASSELAAGMDVDECETAAFFSETPARKLYAVSLRQADGPGTATQNLTFPGQSVAFEPYTRTILASDAGSTLIAFTLSATGTTTKTYTLTQRSGDWALPSDLKPNAVAVKRPANFVCPAQL